MRVSRSSRTPTGVRVLITAWLAAVAIVLATVVPVLGARTPVRLSDASVAPRSVTEGESVTFRVKYRNLDGVAAASVRVEFDGASYALSPAQSKRNIRAGATYQATVRPSAGSGTVRFVATDKRGRSVSLVAGSLTVNAPPPPDPGGSGSGSSGSGSSGSGSSGSGSGSSGSGSSGSGSGSSGSGSSGSGSSGSGSGSSSGDPPGSGASSGASGGGSSSAGSGGTHGAVPVDRGSGGTSDESGAPYRASDDTQADARPAPATPFKPTAPSLPIDEPRTAAADTSRSGRGAPDGLPSAAALGAAGVVLGIGADPLTAVLPVLVTTLGGATMLMAFMIFGKRRRDGEPTDSDFALAAAAATGSGAVASAALVGTTPDQLTIPPPAPVDAEMAMPRWRRPSLLEARKADPMRTAAAPSVSLTFEHGLVDPVAGHERRRIRYRVVRLLDGPDELTALDVGVLDAGDEVQLLERSGVYWYVLCPDGQRGWIHKMTLGEAVDDPADTPGPAERATWPRSADEAMAARLATGELAVDTGRPGGSDPLGHDATMPAPAWTLRGAAATDAGLDVDDDVMQAFLAAQRRG